MSFIDLLSTLGDPVEGETVRIHTDSSMLITGMLPEAQRPLAARPMSEENLWAVVDALCADRQMHTIRRKPGISNAKAEICDRIMRMKLEEISR
jgi:ribonuclease HI